MQEKSPQKRNKLKKTLIILAVTPIVILLMGVIYQNIGMQLNKQKAVLGDIVYLENSTLHLKCTGEGSPTILLDAAAGNVSSSWGWVQPKISETTRVCSYDRASLGWSTQAQQDFSLDTVASTLHDALENRGEQPPYITVGHSMGALYARAFQAKYPSEVSGMVLIDGSSPRQLTEVPDFIKGSDEGAATFDMLSTVAHTGVLRLYFTLGGGFDFASLPEGERREVEMLWSSPKALAHIRDELKTTNSIYEDAAALPDSIGSLPLIVITAAEPVNNVWPSLQQALADISTDSTKHTIENSSHMSLLFDQEHAEQVAAILKDFIQLDGFNQM